MKKCCKCKALKSFDQFGRNKSAKDGMAFECSECVRAYHRQARLVRGDQIRAADKARFHDPARQAVIAKYQASAKGKAAKARANQTWRSQHPDRLAASTAVNNALQSGRLIRQLCLVCGNRKVEGHHPDYSRPLDVVWLCVTHHKEVHMMVQA